ncbi:MAG: hypothetical protein AAGJ35_13755, partial [Myxococcota bacterium]
ETLSTSGWSTFSSWVFSGGLSLFLLPILFTFATMIWGILLKSTSLGRLKEGEWAVWSWGYYRWWLLKLLMTPVRGISSTLVGTPLLPIWYRCLGMNIGKDVYLASALDEIELMEIGEGVSIGSNVQIRCASIESGMLRLRRVKIGADCYVGHQCVLEGGCELKEGVRLHPLSCVAEDTVCPSFSEWRGSPAESLSEKTALTKLLCTHEQRAQRTGAAWQTARQRWKIFGMQMAMVYAFSVFAFLPFVLELGVLAYLEFRFQVISHIG